MFEYSFSPGLRLPLSRARCERLARRVVRQVPVLKHGVMIAFVSDREIRAINKRFRRKDAATDVISFSFIDHLRFKGPKGFDFVGQMYLSPCFIHRQAQRFKVPFRLEFARMFVHGLLHCAGFDHLAEDEARAMFALQERIVRAAADFLGYSSEHIPQRLTDDYFRQSFRFPSDHI